MTTDMKNNGNAAFNEGLQNAYKDGGYPPLPPFAARGSTAVKITAGPGMGEGDAEAFQKYSYSAIIAKIAKSATTLVGSLRDGNVGDPLLRRAITDAHILGFILMNMPCVNRDGREAAALQRVAEAQAAIADYRGVDVDADDRGSEGHGASDAGEGDDQGKEDHSASPTGDAVEQRQRWHAKITGYMSRLYDGPPMPVADLEDFDADPRVDILIDLWNQADSLMRWSRLFEDRHGRKAAQPLYEEVRKMRRQKTGVEFAQSRLPAPHQKYFAARRQLLEIQGERNEDMLRGRDLVDYTAVKARLAEGENVKDNLHELPWIIFTAQIELEASGMDGESYHGLLTAMNSQQRQSWQGQPMPGFPMPGQEPPQEEQDKRGAMFNLFGGGGNDKGTVNKGTVPAQRRPERRGR